MRLELFSSISKRGLINFIKRLINEDNIVGFGFWHGCQEAVEMLVIARFLWSSSNRRGLEMASTRRRHRAT